MQADQQISGLVDHMYFGESPHAEIKADTVSKYPGGNSSGQMVYTNLVNLNTCLTIAPVTKVTVPT